MNRRAWRAILESWALAIVLCAPLLALFPELQARLVQQGMFFIGAAASLWASIRLPHPGRDIRRVAAHTLLHGLVYGGGMVAIFLAINEWLWQAVAGLELADMTMPLASADYFGGAVLIHALAFLVFRSAALLWLPWSDLRRRHLVWSIVQGHMLVAGVALLIVLLLLSIRFAGSETLDNIIGSNVSPPASLAVRLVAGMLPMLSVMAVLGGMALAAVLPLTALASVFVARRTTRRLRALAEATSALRRGDYAVRVPVTGEDEVAALQADFNSMAADLSQTVEALRAERETVARLLQSQRELVAGVSHELRTPLAVARSYLESLQQRTDLKSAERELDIIERELLRLQTIIDDLFTLSRAEVDQLDVRAEPVQVDALVKRVVETYQPLAWQAQRVQIVADVPSSLPTALADEARLEQVLRNLITNGVRHCPPGGLVAVAARGHNGTVELRVRDTGEGILPQDLPHIWERYYHDSRHGGTGLGLSLVKSLVTAMRGEVAVESTPGEGACFIVRLPAQTSPA